MPASYVGPWLWKVWEALRLKHPRRGHEVSSAARAPGTECADFPAFQSVRSRLPERLPHCLSDAAPGQRFSPQNVYLRWWAVARVWVRAAHFCSAMLTTCFLVEEPCAVQHRGGSRVEQRVQLQVGCCLSRDRNWLCRHYHTRFNALSTAEGVTIARNLDPPTKLMWFFTLELTNDRVFMCARVLRTQLTADLSGPTGQSTQAVKFSQWIPGVGLRDCNMRMIASQGIKTDFVCQEDFVAGVCLWITVVQCVDTV